MARVYRGKDGKLYDGIDNYLNGVASPSMCSLDVGVEIGPDGMDTEEWWERNTELRSEYAWQGFDQGVKGAEEQIKQSGIDLKDL